MFNDQDKEKVNKTAKNSMENWISYKYYTKSYWNHSRLAFRKYDISVIRCFLEMI